MVFLDHVLPSKFVLIIKIHRKFSSSQQRSHKFESADDWRPERDKIFTLNVQTTNPTPNCILNMSMTPILEFLFPGSLTNTSESLKKRVALSSFSSNNTNTEYRRLFHSLQISLDQ